MPLLPCVETNMVQCPLTGVLGKRIGPENRDTTM